MKPAQGNKCNMIKYSSLNFPQKLFKLINTKNPILHWGQNGCTILLNFTNLERYLENNTFFETKFRTSFTRKLNRYGFKKHKKEKRYSIRSVQDTFFEYSHIYFQRGRSDLLKNIKLNKEKNIYMLPADDNNGEICQQYTPLIKARENLTRTLEIQYFNMRLEKSRENIPILDVPAKYFGNPNEDIPKYIEQRLAKDLEESKSEISVTEFYMDFETSYEINEEIFTKISETVTQESEGHRNNNFPNFVQEPSSTIVHSNGFDIYEVSGTSNQYDNYIIPDNIDSNIKFQYYEQTEQKVIPEHLGVNNESEYDIENINNFMAPFEYSTILQVPVEEPNLQNDMNIDPSNESTNEIVLYNSTPSHEAILLNQINTLPSFTETFENTLYNAHPVEYDAFSENDNPDLFNNEQYLESAIENFLTQIRESINILND